MSDDKLTGVYQIRNTLNGKLYVGSAARNFRHRWTRHRNDLMRGDHPNCKLQNAWNKYGEGAFVFEILVTCPRELCVHFEQVVMDRLNTVRSGYNIAPKAGSILGMVLSAEQIALNPTRQKGRILSPEARANIAKAQLGRKHSSETKQKIAQAARLRIRKPVREETKAKIAATLRKRPPVSDEVRAKLSASCKAAWTRRKQ